MFYRPRSPPSLKVMGLFICGICAISLLDLGVMRRNCVRQWRIKAGKGDNEELMPWGKGGRRLRSGKSVGFSLERTLENPTQISKRWKIHQNRATSDAKTSALASPLARDDRQLLLSRWAQQKLPVRAGA